MDNYFLQNYKISYKICCKKYFIQNILQKKLQQFPAKKNS